MEPILLEISIGAMLAGSALFAYVIKIKNRLKKRILRDYTAGISQTGDQGG
jgi:hypothetical protein